MNERIQALVEQATSRPYRDQGVGGEPTHIYPGTFSVEKFAELIVRECVMVGGTAFLNDNSKVPIFPAKQIREHFGVEP